MRALLLLALALLLAACGPSAGDSYTDPATRSSVRVVATGACEGVRADAPTIAEQEFATGLHVAQRLRDRGVQFAGPLEDAEPPEVRDLTGLEDEPPSSCVAFVVRSGGLVIGLIPEEVVIVSRAAFLERFEPAD